MSSSKKGIRKAFRDSCFKRDDYCCAKCGFKSSIDLAEKQLDAHHIINREAMPNGGYVKQNGISLCSECHIKAEEFYRTGTPVLGFSVQDLFDIINSNTELAIKESNKLK